MRLKHDIEVSIATAKSASATQWKNEPIKWSSLLDRLAKTKRTPETIKDYFAMPKADQDRIKDVGGFVGGFLEGGAITRKSDGKVFNVACPYGIRRKANVRDRQVVALDIDYGDLSIWDDFINTGYTGAIYSTHKHTPTKPRLRLVLPLSRPVSPDEYEAVARTVASWFGNDYFDDTTYQPVRLMYWPSTSSDGEYFFEYTDGDIIDPDDVLAELKDWTNPTTWPTSTREAGRIRTFTTDKASDPLEKDGVVGAFNNVFFIADAIDEFLPDVYTPTADPDRYTYVGGSTAGGLLIYDDVLAYSHHATDPAATGHTYNAFDLVRVHLFGHLDEGVKEGTPVTKLPSYKAMVEFAVKQPEVKKVVVTTRKKATADVYDDAEPAKRRADWKSTAEAPEGHDALSLKPAKDWLEKLEMGKDNVTIRSTIENAVRIMVNDPSLKGRLGYDEFACRETALSQLPWDKAGMKYPRPLDNRDNPAMRLYLEGAYGISHKDKIKDASIYVGQGNTYNPVTEYLDALEWDGEERLDTLLCDLFGAADTPYLRAITRKAFTACVARAFVPGIKFDHVLVLVGGEGIGKSTLLKAMGREWFSESMDTFKGKEALEQVQGNWIIELGELEALKRADASSAKFFISKQEDRFRVAYGERVEYFPRRCVFFATTNEKGFLKSVNGNRRFWVVDLPSDVEDTYLALSDLTDAFVGQLWAEAVYRFDNGERLYLDRNMEMEARRIQDTHLETDDRAGMVGDFLLRKLPKDWKDLDSSRRRIWVESGEKGVVERVEVCIYEVWVECFDKNPADIGRSESNSIVKILKSLGWLKGKSKRVSPYGVQQVFLKPRN